MIVERGRHGNANEGCDASNTGRAAYLGGGFRRRREGDAVFGGGALEGTLKGRCFGRVFVGGTHEGGEY